jgi:hypothetical protein
MNKNIYIFCLFFLILVACNSTTKNDNIDDFVEVSTFEENLKGDTSFIRFFEEFMWDKEFQVSRIQFPIQYFGKQISSKKDWKHEEFYSKQEFVPIIDTDSTSFYFKNINHNQLIIHFTSLKQQNVRNYTFKKINGKWNFIQAEQIKLAQHIDYEFLHFLSQFWNDSIYQMNNIQFPIDERYSNAEKDYQIDIEKIHKNDWLYWDFLNNPIQIVSFSSENIKTNNRYIYLRGIDNGISIRYTFQKTKSSWRLVLIEDYST